MRYLITAWLAIALLLSACGDGSDGDGLAAGADEPTTVVAPTIEPTALPEPTITVAPVEPTAPAEPTPSATVPTATALPAPTPTTAPKFAPAKPVGGVVDPSVDTRILGNLTYPSGYSDAGTVMLSNGAWESEPVAGGVTTTMTHLYLVAVGDVNADNVIDAAAVLVTDPGGSGTFFDLYVVDGATNKVTEPVNLGDRIRGLEVAIANGKISASFLENDGTVRSDVYVMGNGVLKRTDAPFPLVREFEGSGCFLAGESEVTVNYLGDSSSLVACTDAFASDFQASFDAELVDYVQGYSLFTVAKSDVAKQTFEIRIGDSNAVMIDGTCRVKNGILTLAAQQQGAASADIVRSLQITASLAEQTGSIDYATIAAEIDAEIESVVIADSVFAISGVSTTDLAVTVRGTCRS